MPESWQSVGKEPEKGRKKESKKEPVRPGCGGRWQSAAADMSF